MSEQGGTKIWMLVALVAVVALIISIATRPPAVPEPVDAPAAEKTANAEPARGEAAPARPAPAALRLTDSPNNRSKHRQWASTWA